MTELNLDPERSSSKSPIPTSSTLKNPRRSLTSELSTWRLSSPRKRENSSSPSAVVTPKKMTATRMVSGLASSNL